MVERLNGIQEVGSSNLLPSTKFSDGPGCGDFFCPGQMKHGKRRRYQVAGISYQALGFGALGSFVRGFNFKLPLPTDSL